MSAIKLNAHTKSIVLQQIRNGVPLVVAAQRAGIGERTYYEWVQKGKAAKSGKFREFVDDLEKAQAIAQSSLVARIRKSAKSDWRAAAHILRCRWPDQWGERKAVQQVVITHPGAPISIVTAVGDMTNEQLKILSGVDLDGMGLPTDEDDLLEDEVPEGSK